VICSHCQSVLHVCPECGGRGSWLKSKPEYTRYECDNGHRWNERGGEVLALKRGMKPGSIRLTGKNAKRQSAMFRREIVLS